MPAADLTAEITSGPVATATAELPPPATVATTSTDGSAASADAGPKPRDPDPSDGRCDRCNGCSCVRKVCVAKATEKQITKVCWSYKCEDFCIPGPSIPCGEKCLHDACGCWSYSIWKPTCAEMRTRRVPVKTTVKRKVPTVTWTIEERCQRCRVFCFGVGDGSPRVEASIARPVAEEEMSADATERSSVPPAPDEVLVANGASSKRTE